MGASITVAVNGGAAGPAGRGALNAAATVAVNLNDVGGGSPVSRAWTIDHQPAPLAAPPALSTPTLAASSFTPVTPGTYQLTLTRVEADNVSVTRQSVLVGVPDAHGFVLPSPGIDEHLYAQFAGATTITSGSNGAVLPQATINVADATQFPTSGSVSIAASGGATTVTYTGTTATSLTGCTGGSGTLATGQAVTSPAQASAARLAGWLGSVPGGTNVLFDAWLRDLSVRAGGGVPTIQPLDFGGIPLTSYSSTHLTTAYTVGTCFVVDRPYTCVGVSACWNWSGSGTDTITMQLWSFAGGSLGTGTTTASANGRITVTFTGVALTPGTKYWVSYYCSSSAYTPYLNTGGGDVAFPQPSAVLYPPYIAGPGVYYISMGAATVGHAIPTNSAAFGSSAWFPVSPVFQ